MNGFKYRKDVDGLRALAVFMVIIFHAYPSWLNGGFIGVDIFFVISGYIITNVIYSQVLNGRFSFNHFYIKRIKRILPLFYLVAIASSISAWLLFTPNDLASFGDSLRYATAFIGNLYFERLSGYFAPSSDTVPLLHTWSLAIEEQFYLVWPLVLLACVKFVGPKIRLVLFSLAFVILALASHLITKADPNFGYYIILSRAFELLGGALLAVLMLDQRELFKSIPDRLYNLVGFLSIVLLLGFSVFYSEDMLFPGVNALWVVIITMALIASGSRESSQVNIILGNKLFVYLGRLSYSLYLWHWPILVFYRYSHDSFSASDAILCIAITVVLSILSLHLYENKLRYTKLKSRYVYSFYLIVPIIVFVSFAKFLANNDGIPSRFSKDTQVLFEQTTYATHDYKQTLVKNYQADWLEPFLYGKQNQNLNAVIWGDSHAEHFIGLLEGLSKDLGFSFAYGGLGGCPPTIGSDLIKHGVPEASCSEHNNGVLKETLSSPAKVVFLAARWGMYAETTRSLGEDGGRVYLGTKDNYEESVANSRRALEQGLLRTISALEQNGKTVVLINQVPPYTFKPSNCWIRKSAYEDSKQLNCNQAKADVTERLYAANSILASVVAQHPDTLLLDIQSLLCDTSECVSKLGDTLLYNDNSHLNFAGSKIIYSKLKVSPQFIDLKRIFAVD